MGRTLPAHEDQDLRQSKVVWHLFARAVWATRIIDRGYSVFDRLRSKIVLACASDAFYDIFNDLMYARQDIWRLGTGAFRSSLFPFEERAISRHFPPPPGTILIGAAGGGRESHALAQRGYRIVAFEPARPLAASLAEASSEMSIESLVGRYEDLPIVTSLSQPPATIDLRSRAPFAAAILGWGSISHIRSDQYCIATLRQFGHLTRGPILISYLPGSGGPKHRFRVNMGYYRQFTGAEILALAEGAGLAVVYLDEEDSGMPHAVLNASTMSAKEDAGAQTVSDRS